MGWYDEDEKNGWLPDWATPPLMWVGCLAVAVLPAASVVGLWNAALPDARPVVSLIAYGVSLGLMIAAVKPWTIR